jgi:two-component system chemotaxis response regulator CheY
MDILLVDDSRTMRMLVQRAIRQAGFAGLTFTEAENGAHALAQLETCTPRLILADWNMPQMSGIQFLKQIRAEGDETPFGFITSESSEEIAEDALADGADFLIRKPFTPDDLRGSLVRFLGA